MRSFLKKNGLPSIDVHGFRRMAASYSVSNQVPLTTVQTMLGHKSLSTTMIYLRTLNNSRKEGVEALSNTYQQLMDRKKDDKPEDDSPKP
jgi:integrase